MNYHVMLASTLTAAILGVANPASAQQQDQRQAHATLLNTNGKEIGTVGFLATPHGVHLTATAQDLPEGVHAFHIHETGDCDPATNFESAGGHYAPDGNEHGVLVEAGPHAGDYPNVYVQADGVLAIEYINDRISLAEDEDATLFDDDGSALVLHLGADDYESQPAGDAGDRIVCGVIEQGM